MKSQMEFIVSPAAVSLTNVSYIALNEWLGSPISGA